MSFFSCPPDHVGEAHGLTPELRDVGFVDTAVA
jgi:hypothetical protein